MIGYSIQWITAIHEKQVLTNGKIFISLETLCDDLDSQLLHYYGCWTEEEENISFDTYDEMYQHVKDNDIYIDNYEFPEPTNVSDLELKKLQPGDEHVIYRDYDEILAIVCHEIEE
jgi:hypothetical protein